MLNRDGASSGKIRDIFKRAVRGTSRFIARCVSHITQVEIAARMMKRVHHSTFVVGSGHERFSNSPAANPRMNGVTTMATCSARAAQR